MAKTDMLAQINGTQPIVLLDVGQSKTVRSDSKDDTIYTMTRKDDFYHCTCHSWMVCKGPINSRTCKHLRSLLGDGYEDARRQHFNPYNETASEFRVRNSKDDTKLKAITGNIRSSIKRKNSTGDAETTALTIKRDSLPPRHKKCKSDSEDMSDETDTSDNDAQKDLDMIEELESLKDELLRKLDFVNQQLREFGKYPIQKTLRIVQKAESVPAVKKEEKTIKRTIVTKGKAKATTTTPRKTKAKPSSSSSDDSDDDDLYVQASHQVGAKGRPELLLAEKWDMEKGIDPTGWLMSEKLDGVRAFWNGSEFCSREGNKFYAPEWFTKKFPKDITLDGELFAGRGTFQEAVGIIRTKDQPDRWKFKIEYHVFDIPSMGNKPFETRYAHLLDLFTNKIRIKWVKVASHSLCTGKQHLLSELKKVQDGKGEGLMLRDPTSFYIGKRSRTLLKVKTFLDADAEVIGHEEGSGKDTGLCGALKCKALDGSGVIFKVGSGLSDKLRANPPKIGTTIIYRYFELSNSGHPRFPSYVGERAD